MVYGNAKCNPREFNSSLRNSLNTDTLLSQRMNLTRTNITRFTFFLASSLIIELIHICPSYRSVSNDVTKKNTSSIIALWLISTGWAPGGIHLQIMNRCVLLPTTLNPYTYFAPTWAFQYLNFSWWNLGTLTHLRIIPGTQCHQIPYQIPYLRFDLSKIIPFQVANTNLANILKYRPPPSPSPSSSLPIDPCFPDDEGRQWKD